MPVGSGRFRDHAQDPKGVLGMSFSSSLALSEEHVCTTCREGMAKRASPHPCASQRPFHPLKAAPSVSYPPSIRCGPRSVDHRSQLAQVMSGSTVSKPAKVAKPQSVPAMTCSRPTADALRSRWCATSSGCSIKLVVESSTPGMMALPCGNLISSNTFHSCSWRRLAPSKGTALWIEWP